MLTITKEKDFVERTLVGSNQTRISHYPHKLRTLKKLVKKEDAVEDVFKLKQNAREDVEVVSDLLTYLFNNFQKVHTDIARDSDKTGNKLLKGLVDDARYHLRLFHIHFKNVEKTLEAESELSESYNEKDVRKFKYALNYELTTSQKIVKLQRGSAWLKNYNHNLHEFKDMIYEFRGDFEKFEEFLKNKNNFGDYINNFESLKEKYLTFKKFDNKILFYKIKKIYETIVFLQDVSTTLYSLTEQETLVLKAYQEVYKNGK